MLTRHSFLYDIEVASRYCGGIVSYAAAAVGAPFVTIIPVVNLWAGIFPMVITKPIAILGTFYLLAANGVIFYAPPELGKLALVRLEGQRVG